MTDREQLAQEIGQRLKDRAVRIRTLERENRKLQERLNRISNVMIGNARIWQLDRLAMELKVEADLIDQAIVDNLASENEDDIWTSDERAAKYNQAVELRADALFLERIEYDLGEMHTAVRGDTNRRDGRYDQSQWKGPRP